MMRGWRLALLSEWSMSDVRGDFWRVVVIGGLIRSICPPFRPSPAAVA